jgi:hypothetical protein
MTLEERIIRWLNENEDDETEHAEILLDDCLIEIHKLREEIKRRSKHVDIFHYDD